MSIFASILRSVYKLSGAKKAFALPGRMHLRSPIFGNRSTCRRSGLDPGYCLLIAPDSTQVIHRHHQRPTAMTASITGVSSCRI